MSLAVNINDANILVMNNTPLEEFWDFIFFDLGSDYLLAEGLQLGEILESSLLTSATVCPKQKRKY